MTSDAMGAGAVEVTQADRDFFRQFRDAEDWLCSDEEIDGGEFDTDPSMQTIARHRLAPTPSPQRADASETIEARGQTWKRWGGGETAPVDWNGGRVLLADDQIVHPYQSDGPFDWTHDVSETGCLEPGCIVGYVTGVPLPDRPATAAASPEVEEPSQCELAARARRFGSCAVCGAANGQCETMGVFCTNPHCASYASPEVEEAALSEARALCDWLEQLAAPLLGPVTPMPSGGARITIHPTRAAQLAEAIGQVLAFARAAAQPQVERPPVKQVVAWSDDRLGQAYQLIDEVYQDWPSESGPGEALRTAREAVEAADMEMPE